MALALRLVYDGFFFFVVSGLQRSEQTTGGAAIS
jgi:hypothetical protein